MKKIILIVSAVMTVATSYAKSNALVSPFERVSVNVPACVRFVKGDTYGVSVRSANAYEASAVRWEVADGVLRFSSVDPAPEVGGVCITIVSPTEPELTLGRDVEVSHPDTHK